MKIQVAGLSDGVHEFSFREPVAEVDLGQEFSGEVEVDVMLEKSGKQLYVKAVVRAGGVFPCDRCTIPFSLALRSTFQMLYVWGPADEELLDSTEVRVIPAGLPVVNLADDVRETVLLAVPLKLLCTEECRGLCPRCGADLNKESCVCPPESDARWATLRRFRTENN